MLNFGFLPRIQLAAAIVDRFRQLVPATHIELAGMVFPQHLPAIFLLNPLNSMQKTVLRVNQWTAMDGCDILSTREIHQAYGKKAMSHGRQGICIGKHDRRNE